MDATFTLSLIVLMALHTMATCCGANSSAAPRNDTAFCFSSFASFAPVAVNELFGGLGCLALGSLIVPSFPHGKSASHVCRILLPLPLLSCARSHCRRRAADGSHSSAANTG